MLESFILARDHYLKPGGRIFPTTGVIHLAPFSDQTLYAETIQKARFSTRFCVFTHSVDGGNNRISLVSIFLHSLALPQRKHFQWQLLEVSRHLFCFQILLFQRPLTLLISDTLQYLTYKSNILIPMS